MSNATVSLCGRCNGHPACPLCRRGRSVAQTPGQGHLAATLFVRNEADCLPGYLTNLFRQGVRALYAADHGSTDGTHNLLLRHPLTRCLLSIPDRGDYPQAEVMADLAQRAWRAGAGWIVNTDADERWFGLSLLAGLPADVVAVAVPVWNHAPGGGVIGRVPTDKVAHRAAARVRLCLGNHLIDRTTVPAPEGLLVRHYPVRSWQQFQGKVARARELLPSLQPWDCPHWRSWVAADDAGKLLEEYDRIAAGGMA